VRPTASSNNSAGTQDPGQNDSESRFHNRDPQEQEFDPFLGPASPIDLANLPQGAAAFPSIWLLVIGGAVLLLVIVAGVGMWTYENRGVRPRGGSRGGEWAFDRMARMASWLRIRLMPWQTPYEQAQALSSVMPHSEAAIEHVASLYVMERYGRSQIDPVEVQVTWRSLRKPMWWAGFKRRIPRTLPSRRQIFHRAKTDRA
jgi:hypothetical protein